MIISNQQQLIEFIQTETNPDTITKVFENCIGSKVLVIWKDDTGTLFNEWKEHLIAFVNDYGFKPIEQRPLIVNPFK
jgi:hypothetical protein